MSTDTVEAPDETPQAPLDVSDEEFNDLNFEDYTDSDTTSNSMEEETPPELEEGGIDQETDEATLNAEDETSSTETEEEEIETTGTEEASSDSTTESDTDTGSTDKTDNGDKDTITVDFESEYKKLLAPFRANSKDMQVDSVEDARTLMQMGANYNKKMAGLKPNLKLIKMLDNNNLLSEEKLSYLIDLDKKNPDAIKRLIKESGIDMDTLDVDDKATEYKPNTYTVDDKEVDLDGILDEIKDTESFNQTIDIISNKWDSSSKQVAVNNPGLIKTINDHITTGIYEKIMNVVEHNRALGKLNGLSDLEAYKQIGDTINAQGGFQPKSNISIPKKSTPNSEKLDKKLRSKKKAASPTKSAGTPKGKPDFNPLDVSDEEFEKMAASKFI